MYLVPVVQLTFLVILSFAVSRLMKMKSKVNRSGKTFSSEQLNLSVERIVEFLTPSFIGSHGIYFPQFLVFRNCFSYIWKSGHLLITFDPTTAFLDLLSLGTEFATKSIQDDTNKESLLFYTFYNRFRSLSHSYLNTIKNLVSFKPVSSSDEDYTPTEKIPVIAGDQKNEKKECPVPKIAESVFNKSKQVVEDVSNKVVVKVVVAAGEAAAATESKWNVYRFRVAKEGFAFEDLKKVIEERATKLKDQWKLKYQDDENEWITVQNQLEWEEAVRVGKDLVRLHVA